MADEQDTQLKLLMLGDSGVGKSCLVLRFANESKAKIESLPTIGIDFKIKRIVLNGRKLKLQIWDTAGQERYRTITTSYYRGSQGILVVYDITDRNSFVAIRNWLLQIKQHADVNVVKILLGNKCDLQVQRAVTFDEGAALAREFNMKFCETSAQQDLNVNQAFITLTQEILDSTSAAPAQAPTTPTANAPIKGKDLKQKPAKRSWC